MADDKNLIIRIEAKTASFNQALKKARSETENLQKNLSALTKKAAIGFTAVTVAIGATVKAYANYQSALIGVAKTTGLAGKELDDFSKGIDNLAKTIPQLSPTELLALAKTAGQLGVKGKEDLLAFTETYAKLGTATNIAGEEGAAAIARLLKVTGDGVQGIGKFGDVIVELGNNSAATEAEILHMATRLSSLASFGAGSTEILGIAAAMKSVGLEAESAGTSTARAFDAISSAINDGGDKLETLKKVTGLTADELKKRFAEDSVGVFKLFSEGLAAVPANELKTNLDEMGLSSTRVRDLFRKLSTSGDTLAASIDLANKAAQEGTALNIEFDAASKSLNSSFGLLKNAILTISKNIGKELAPTIERAVKAATSFINAINDMGQGTFSLIATLLKWAGAITGITALLGGLGLAVLSLRAGLKALGIQALLTNKSFLAFGAGLFKVTGITRAFTAISALSTTALKAMGIAGAGAWKKILLPITGAIAAYAGFKAILDKINTSYDKIAGSSEGALKKAIEKTNTLKGIEEKLQERLKSGSESSRKINTEKLESVQKEIAASEILQKVIQKEIDLKSQTASASLPLAAEESESPTAPEIGMDAPVSKEKTDAIINEKVRETDLKIAEAEREREALKAIREGSSEEEVQALRDKNALISELDQLKLQEELLRNEEKTVTKDSGREAEIEKELELNTIQQEALQGHLDVLEEIKIEDDERKTEREGLFNELSDEKKKGRDKAEIEALKKNLKTDKELKIANAKQEAGRVNRDRAKFLKDEQKHGTTIAKMNKTFRSDGYKGTQQALGNLASLRNAKSKKAQKLGKAAAIAQATVSTFEGATKAFTSMAGIPVVGPALGAAAAAAAVAAGFVQIQNISSTPISGAVAGGLVTGGITGKDTEPFMLAKGEAVTPADVTPALMNTFKELRNLRDNGGLLNAITQDSNLQPSIRTNTVINESETIRSSIDTVREESEPQQVNIDINIEEDAVDFITAQQRENEALSIGTI
jgi:TP901 family phage tail tape measure protein